MFPSQTRTTGRQAKGPARTFPFGRAALFALASLALSACSLVIDTEEPQCQTTDDCTAAFGATSPYVCQSNFCVRPTCETTTDCRNLGPQFATAICDGNKLCSTAECVSNEQCGIGAVCDVSNNVCIPKQCDTTDECKSKAAYNSPLVTCQAGICVDEAWGCIGDPDNRPAPLMQTATMKIRVEKFGSPDPHLSVEGRVCNTPTFGDPCTQTLPGSASTYDATSKWLSFTGVPLQYSWRYFIQAGPNPESTDPKQQPIGIDFYSQKTPQDVFEAPAVVTTVTRALLDFLAQAFEDDVDIPENSAGATLFVFDCQDRPAPGVVLASVGPNSRVTYFGQTGTPDPNATETGPSGMMSVINMPSDNTVTLKASVKVGSTLYPLPEFQVHALTGRLTTIHLYPRNYVR